MTKAGIFCDYEAFRKASVTEQIRLLHESFSFAAQQTSYKPEMDKQLTELLSVAVEQAHKLREKGKTEKSRISYLFTAWVEFLNADQVYRLHVLTLQKLYHSLAKLSPNFRYDIQLFPFVSNIFRLNVSGNRVTLLLHECFVCMTDKDIEDLSVLFSTRKWKRANSILKPVYKRKAVQKICDAFQTGLPAKKIEIDTQGKYYDLGVVFDRVNREYFGGIVQLPQLHWSAKVNKTRMGSYDQTNDILMVNRGLDKKNTPPYVVEFIMYHEVLHKVLGTEVIKGRRIAHSSEFRRYEKQYPKYTEAEAWLKCFKR